MLVNVNPNTTWTDGKGKNFLVLGVYDKEDRTTWVYYREDKGIGVPALECNEYSCYVQAFAERFRELP